MVVTYDGSTTNRQVLRTQSSANVRIYLQLHLQLPCLCPFHVLLIITAAGSCNYQRRNSSGQE